MPTARYSWRTMSANSRTRSAEPIAASPSGSGHREKGPAIIWVSGLSPKWCRGSEENVTGMPSGCRSAADCTLLCHWAKDRPSGSEPRTLKCRRPLSTSERSERSPNSGTTASTSAGTAMVWNISPTLSASGIRDSRSSTRWCTDNPAS